MTHSIVTGGAGFLGSHLVDALVKRGQSVVVLDNLTTGQISNLEAAISSGRVTFVYADVAVDPHSLRSIVTSTGVRKFDHIYHLAPPANGLPAWEALDGADPGTLSLVDIAIEQRAKFIFCSKLDGVDDSHGASLDHFDSEQTKRIEAMISEAALTHSLDARIARFCNCYGPRMQMSADSWLASLLEAAANGQPLPVYGSGQENVALTFAGDAVAALIALAERPRPVLNRFNIINTEGRPAIDVARVLADVAGVNFEPVFSSAPARPEARRQHDVEIASAHALPWKTKTSLEDGLRLTWEWFSRESRLFV